MAADAAVPRAPGSRRALPELDDVAGKLSGLLHGLLRVRGGCRLVVVSGPPGVGKRTVINDALATLPRWVVVVRCEKDVEEMNVRAEGGVVCVVDDLEACGCRVGSERLFESYMHGGAGARRIAVVVRTKSSAAAPAVVPPDVLDVLAASSQQIDVPLPSHATRLILCNGDAELAARTQGCSVRETLMLVRQGGGGGVDKGGGANRRLLALDARTPPAHRSRAPDAYHDDGCGALATLLRCVEAFRTRHVVAGDESRLLELGAVARASGRLTTPTGILIMGPSGCGKTLLAEQARRVSGVSVMTVSAPSLFGAWLGETEARIRGVFADARAAAPACVILDDIDAVGARRGLGAGDDDAASSGVRALSALLCELDGIGGNDGVAVIGCTSLPWALDPALLRQGRLEKVIHQDLPPPDARKAFLHSLLSAAAIADDVSVESLAGALAGHTPATMKYLCRTAGMCALREYQAAGGSGSPMLRQCHFDDALRHLPPPPSQATVQRYADFAAAVK